MSESNEYVIDGSVVNKLLDPFNFESPLPTAQFHHMLPGQVYDVIEKKFIKSLADEIEKSKAQTVRFVNLEAIATGSHKDYLHPICAGLRVLIDSLTAKNIAVTGTIQNPLSLPWDLAAKIDKNFKGLPAPGESAPP
ncbi:MAG: hypothetical protein ABSD49_00225 [Candidatus Bathyarchaeia archaeon]|jgi:hypothetical protein